MVQFGSLSLLGEGWGEGLSENCNHNVAAGFSPQSVQGFFAALTSFKNQLVVRLDNRLKPGELFRVCRAKPSPRPLPKREGGKLYPIISVSLWLRVLVVKTDFHATALQNLPLHCEVRIDPARQMSSAPVLI